MRKFNVGDYVKVREDLNIGVYYGNTSASPEMCFKGGQIVKIKEFLDFNGYYIENDNHIWSEEMFEGLVEKERSIKTKFKLGDKVVVREDLLCDEYYGGKKFSVYMQEFLGKTLTIRTVHELGYFTEGNTFFWTDEMFKDLAYSKPIFTKADLKDGMVVEFANGDRAVVMNGLAMQTTMFIYLNQFEDDLTCEAIKECTINKVYKSNGKTFKEYLFDDFLELIWERKEEEEKVLYNGRVVCIDAINADYVKGKIHEIKNGVLIDDYPAEAIVDIVSVEDLNNRCSSATWLAIVE